MSGQNSDIAASPVAKGTPKIGYHCHTCEDWGTIVIDDGNFGREVPCPNAEAHGAGQPSADG